MWVVVIAAIGRLGITGRFFDPLKMAEVRGLMFDV
jgi:hypothetical protein